MGEYTQVSLERLGRGRSWAQRAAQGEIVEITGDHGRPLAYLVPATEPITPDVIEESLTRINVDDDVRIERKNQLLELAQAGYRWHRVRNVFAQNPPM